ncbi:BLUF domain-containing protein [Roseovarius faecimaris]|uniref:BLUF domain-containing protein n=1 Tax=Roseovarius faecimaris TaxID=2494550 RepID=A0A6I6IVQ3_9RHOB|nr:BLUF domain-containing protein [Roseovarius faecimaris]QGX96828.1 BLUF domain-containing protein [Roseovarius faecimaris]
MPLTQLIYASTPFGFDASLLSNILLDARRCNARDDITGALIARQDLFLQLLEGPEDKVNACYQRIRRDDRHVEVTKLMQRSIKTRLFPSWAMRDDPAYSWMWTMEEVANGAVERATEDEVLNFFTRLSYLKVFPSDGA